MGKAAEKNWQNKKPYKLGPLENTKWTKERLKHNKANCLVNEKNARKEHI